MNLTYPLFDIITDIPHAILYFGYNARMLDVKNKWLYIISSNLFSAMTVYLNHMGKLNLVTRMVLIFLLSTFYVFFYIREGWIRALAFTGFNFVIVTSCEGLGFIISYMVIGEHITYLKNNFLWIAEAKIIFVCVYLIFINALCVLWSRLIDRRRSLKISLFLPLITIQSLFFFVLTWMYFEKKISILMSKMCILCWGCGLILDYFVYFYLNENSRKEMEKEKESQLAIQLTNQNTRARLLENDIKNAEQIKENILRGLKNARNFLEEKCGKEAKVTLGEITEQIAWKRLYSENRVVDAIVSDKAKECTEKNIRLQTELDIPEKLPVKNAELCVIFANLLDNAIRACERLEGQEKEHDELEIRLAARERGGYLVIREENPFDGTVEDRKQGPLSEHGLGLGIVEQIAQKYEGRLQTEQEEGKFVTVVMLKMG